MNQYHYPNAKGHNNQSQQLQIKYQVSDSRNLERNGSRFESADFIDYMIPLSTLPANGNGGGPDSCASGAYLHNDDGREAGNKEELNPVSSQDEEEEENYEMDDNLQSHQGEKREEQDFKIEDVDYEDLAVRRQEEAYQKLLLQNS